eukprot:728672-Pyramimonas_sp.AAC.1
MSLSAFPKFSRLCCWCRVADPPREQRGVPQRRRKTVATLSPRTLGSSRRSSPAGIGMCASQSMRSMFLFGISPLASIRTCRRAFAICVCLVLTSHRGLSSLRRGHASPGRDI